MRTAQDATGGGATNTPIYDALYSEYRRLFRTLPGDRSGEESLQFKGFAAWHTEYPPFAPGGRHRSDPADGPNGMGNGQGGMGNGAGGPQGGQGGRPGTGRRGGANGDGPAALPPGRGDNRMR
ncbi:hypothetical protein [Actinacidiphila yanglinensis]|nr:hypothetical protein [Actinacidiphila yanglinensis]